MRKCIVSLLLILSLVASLIGIVPASADSLLSAEKQLEIIMKNVSLWNCNDGYSVYSYAVTDLDGNGRLEIFAAITEGTGIFTYGKLFEVDAAGTLREITLLSREGDSLPEVIVSSANVWSDPANGRKYYIFQDDMRNGASEYGSSLYGFSLYRGRVLFEHICGFYSVYRNGSSEPETTYYGADFQTIGKQKYDTAVSEYFRGYQHTKASFGWFQFLDGDFSEIVRKSWNTFSSALSWTPAQGNSSSGGITITLPPSSAGITGNQTSSGNTVTVYENPQAAAVAAKPLDDIPTGSNGGIRITKNPTAESITVGGKNWFIAHASGASSMEWQLIDTNNRVYSTDAAVNANPGLRIDTNTKDTLEISNVPASLNGWSARAVFSNGDASCATVPAAIYVGDFVTLYGSVINAYRTAYQNGMTKGDLQQLWDLGVSEWVSYSDSVGYGMKDLDKNGTPELIITGTGANNHANNVLYDVYTLQDNVPVCLCTSQARDRFYLRTDSSILEEGSGGASAAYYAISKLKNGKLTQLEALRSDLNSNNDIVWYFSTNGGNETQISESAAQEKIKAYKDAIYLPVLTQIA